MNALIWNILLALVWTMVTGEFTPRSFLLGFLVGFVVLLLTHYVPGVPRYSWRPLRAVELGLYTAWQLVLANIRVAIDVSRPSRLLRPAVIDVPLDVKTDTEITLVAALITLTPGTTAVGLSRDRRTLYVHMTNLGAADVEEARRQIKDGFEQRVLEVMR
jgi:multicomponent Na+:H+ antiporter subunit E